MSYVTFFLSFFLFIYLLLARKQVRSIYIIKSDCIPVLLLER